MDVQSDVQHSVVDEPLALLTLPGLDGLSEAQVRGATCVWCGIALSANTAVGLGERRHRRLDGHFSTFPRSCRPCTQAAAQEALGEHPGMCEQCLDDSSLCEVRAALKRVAEGHRP